MPLLPSTPAAHSPNEAGRWHDLREHLESVAGRAQRFAAKFGAGEWGALAGLWHDLGKYHPDFQHMLHDVVQGRPKRHVDHSTLGALHASEVVGRAFLANPVMRQVEFLTLMITASIAGYHVGGLPESRDALRARFDGELLEQAIPVEARSSGTHNVKYGYQKGTETMGSRIYSVALEIAGPAAMFTRPDTGSAPVSYPAPTLSAARGIFEAIARLQTARIRPTKVEICRPVRYARYFTNYGGPLRKSNQLRLGASYQLPATILVDVCYRLYGAVEERSRTDRATNHLHHLQAMFDRRLGKGQNFYVPCLGWKEFAASYVGPFRAKTQVEESANLTIPSMLHELLYDRGQARTVEPVFRQNVPIEKGVLLYAQ